MLKGGECKVDMQETLQFTRTGRQAFAYKRIFGRPFQEILLGIRMARSFFKI